MLDWFEARSGARAATSGWLDSPLPGGAHWARTFGALTLILFAVEALTGVGLAAWYAPTTTDAWASTHFIQHQLTLGWLLRGMHHVTGNVLIVVALLHLVQGLLWGAWKAPRELTWIAGLLGLQALILISHTGYLLPWDLRAYWATQVLVGIAGNQPLVGELAMRVIQGGEAVGNPTLTHLYAMHTLLTPGLFAGAVGLYFWLGRKHSAPTPWGMSPETAAERAQTWFPFQLTRDLAAATVVLLGVALYVWRTHGVDLGAPADPAVEYVARPEWYFLPIFWLRHFFTGSSEFVATTVIPGLGVTFLAALPFLYARMGSTPRAQRSLVAASFTGLLGAGALGAATAWTDAGDKNALAINARADTWAKQAAQLAMIGVPVEGPLKLHQNDPLVWGELVFKRECAACHGPADQKPYEADLCLDGFGSRTWIKRLLQDPRAPHFFGNTKIDLMDAYDGEGDEAALAEVVEFLYAQSGRPDADAHLAELGRARYLKDGCESCHTLDGVGLGEGAADLKGWASPEWLAAFIREPGHPRFYGEINEMDAFDAEKVDPRELKAVIAWLRAQTDEKVTY